MKIFSRRASNKSEVSKRKKMRQTEITLNVKFSICPDSKLAYPLRHPL